MLDGREVSDTERLFLASWKATRKARRKALHQHKVQQGELCRTKYNAVVCKGENY